MVNRTQDKLSTLWCNSLPQIFCNISTSYDCYDYLKFSY